MHGGSTGKMPLPPGREYLEVGSGPLPIDRASLPPDPR
jgi:hypothetical protein